MQDPKTIHLPLAMEIYCVQQVSDSNEHPSLYTYSFNWYKSLEQARRRVEVIKGLGFFDDNKTNQLPIATFENTPYKEARICIWKQKLSYTDDVHLALVVAKISHTPWVFGKIAEVYSKSGNLLQPIKDGKLVGDEYLPADWTPKTSQEKNLMIYLAG